MLATTHRSRLRALGLALALAAAVIATCAPARAERPVVTIALTANVKALLTTCSTCKSVTVGGMPQKATLFGRWRKTRAAFTALDAGDWSEYGAEFSKNLTMILAMKRLGYAAANVGDSEAAFGSSVFDAARHRGLPLVSANLLHAETGERVLPPDFVTTVKGVRIGVTGVIGPQAAETGYALPARYRLGDVREALADRVPKLRPRCDILVVLAHVPLEEIKRLAAAIPGIDVMVGGCVHGKVPDGEMVGKTLVVQPHRYAVVLLKMVPTVPSGYRPIRWPSYVVQRSTAQDPEMKALVEKGTVPN